MQILSRRVKKSRHTDLSKWECELPPEQYRLLEWLLSTTHDGERVVAVRVCWSDGFAAEYVDEAHVDEAHVERG